MSMKTITVVVRPDGLVKIPGTRAGQTVTIQVDLEQPASGRGEPLSAEEQERRIELLLQGGKQVREQSSSDWLSLDHGEWLYGPDGLPR